MLVLVHSAPMSLLRDHGKHPNLGVLCSPRNMYTGDIQDWPWAADNDAYNDWSELRYRKMLDRISGRSGCLFVVVPDVVGDHRATLSRFWDWLPEVRECGQPIAFVAQNGATPGNVPWRDFDVLFVGGNEYPDGGEWKCGNEAKSVVDEAHRRGKWVHMGRVNTRQRIVYAKAIGCASFDGTNFSMFRRTNLPWALRYAAAEPQLMLGGAA